MLVADMLNNGVLEKTQAGYKGTIPVITFAQVDKWCKIWHEKFKDLSIEYYDALYKARNNATKCINQSLLVVGEQMKLPIPLTMHVARHTFAVLALNHKVKQDDGKEVKKPISMSVLSRLLGHASTDTTEKVYAEYLQDTLKDEVKELNFNFLPNELSELNNLK